LKTKRRRHHRSAQPPRRTDREFALGVGDERKGEVPLPGERLLPLLALGGIDEEEEPADLDKE
jgi:hypothetical protein